ncbi:hypothetical protein BaRGS_00029297, partial [Batillaria attramentaria]
LTGGGAIGVFDDACTVELQSVGFEARLTRYVALVVTSGNGRSEQGESSPSVGVSASWCRMQETKVLAKARNRQYTRDKYWTHVLGSPPDSAGTVSKDSKGRYLETSYASSSSRVGRQPTLSSCRLFSIEGNVNPWHTAGKPASGTSVMINVILPASGSVKEDVTQIVYGRLRRVASKTREASCSSLHRELSFQSLVTYRVTSR